MRETTQLPPPSRDQEASILEFSGRWRFLSNFHPSQIEHEGITFATVEHAFQAAKTLDFASRLEVARQTSPGRAKRAGRRLELRPDWEPIKFGLMKTLVVLKFTTHPQLASQLLSTGNRHLEEGNRWGDTVFGTCDGVGENRLGCTLMEVRAQIRNLGAIFPE